MRTKSPKARAADKAAKEFMRNIPWCEVCRRKPATDCHEIKRGAWRLKARGKSFACLGVCRSCHDELDDTAAYPASRQLWLLRRARPEDFNLERYLEAFHPRALYAVTLSEIDAWKDKT